MSLKIVEKENWNNFLLQNDASFLQSFEWGEFQEKLGRKIWRLSVENNGETMAQALVVKKPLPFGKSFLYVPFGPCLASEQTMQELLGELQKIAKAENSIYCYIEPLEGVKLLPFRKEFHSFQKPQKRIQPQQTLVIDLTPPEEQIFKGLKSKTTRYNIRFAQKQGVKFIIPEIIRDKEIDIFYNLAQKSAERDGFANYSGDYFSKLFSISSQEMQVKLFFAKHQDNYIAANIFVFFNRTAVHLFGGFDHDFRHLMAPYFMHWNQILFAKNKMNCAIYDFWGIDEKKWPGVTHFKRSFGGKEIQYPQGHDVVYSKFWYQVFKIARKFLKK
ncbi:MAG: peptidoglycan bridge formation glycyltransferase FemA/FemB family protein [Candidatus Pacebacteria bacterium]|nr:peptidoglycan bridge formation glycyltransferase FemA/FemB family protein [Candidatus Paceibacterota bacterium]